MSGLPIPQAETERLLAITLLRAETAERERDEARAQVAGLREALDRLREAASVIGEYARHDGYGFVRHHRECRNSVTVPGCSCGMAEADTALVLALSASEADTIKETADALHERAEKAERERDEAREIAAAREEEREYARRAEHAAIAKRVLAERERDEARALAEKNGQRWSAAVDATIHQAESALELREQLAALRTAAQAVCDSLGTGVGSRAIETVAALGTTLAASPAGLARQVRAQIVNQTLSDAAAIVMCGMEHETGCLACIRARQLRALAEEDLP